MSTLKAAQRRYDAMEPPEFYGDPFTEFTEEYDRQLAALPHHRRATVLSMPGGYEARQLAANVARTLEEKGTDP